MSETQVIFRGGSDHRLILCTRYTKSVIGRKRVVKKRSFKNFSPGEFLKALSKISWWDVYSCNDVNLALSRFNAKVSKVLDEFAPVKSFQVRNNYVPWLSKETQELMKERNTAQHRAATTGLDEDWHLYRQLRNQVNRSVKNVKNKWQTVNPCLR